MKQVRPGFRLTEEYILRLHSIVMYNFSNKLPGAHRTGYVNLANTDKKLPAAREVPLLMRKLVKGINNYGTSHVRSMNLRPSIRFLTVTDAWAGLSC